MYEVKSYGKTYQVSVNPGKYVKGGLALKMGYLDEEFGCEMPFATLTVNLGMKLGENEAFVDTNNCPWAEEFIEKYGLGEPTGELGFSGYCVYPAYKFDLSKIEGGV